ncbi:MAG: DUF445 family protein [Deltaproteobacteria bacterium]|nr:DUF445 family protein [Deltaproteobacteria bacterium]
MMNFQHWLPYLAPPAVGAVIGYFTNYLAIRMLFRPLTEKRIFGLRLPLTPGIIPAKRRELARNIGRMVGDHLLTREVIVARLQARDFQDGLYMAIARRFQAVFERDLGPPAALLPADFQPDLERLARYSRHYLYGLVDRLLESEAAGSLVTDLTAKFVNQALGESLSSLVRPEAYAVFRLRLRDALGGWLASETVQGWLRRELEQGFSRLLSSPKPLAQVIPADLQELLLNQLRQELPDLMASLSRLLYDPNIRQRIKQRIRNTIANYISKMGFWKKLLTSWALPEETLARKVDELVDAAGEDIAAALQQPRVQERVLQVLEERLAAFLAVPVNELARKVSYQKLAGTRDYLIDKIVALLGRAETADRGFALFEQLLARFNERPFGQLAAELGFPALEEKLAAALGDRLLRFLRRRQVKKELADRLHRLLLEYCYQVPLGKLSLKIPYEVLEKTIMLVYRRTCDLLEAELPQLTDRIDIPRVVEERINVLPVIQVEALLMDIMKEHFTYINIFGGLLGALIGAIQVLFMLYLY